MSRVANRRVVTPQTAAPQAFRPAASEQAAPEAPAFDYSAEAELYPTRNQRTRRAPFGFRRFSRASEAIRFAVEELSPSALAGAYLEVSESRFDRHGIQRLYDSGAFPLKRRQKAS